MHKGHLTILRHLAAAGFAEVRMVVSPESPFKKGSDDTADKRLAAVRKKVARLIPEVTVSDVEFGLPKPNYTINTLRALQQAEPDTDFVIAMGADNFADIERWREWESIVNDFEIWVYPRTGYDVKELCARHGAHLMNTPLVDISSTEIREGRADKDLMI